MFINVNTCVLLYKFDETCKVFYLTSISRLPSLSESVIAYAYNNCTCKKPTMK